jgi:putative ABC transport system permease protein
MKVLLSGVWSRRGMNAAILLVSVIAVTAAVLGPMYGRESAEHLLDTRLDERAPYVTGLTAVVPGAKDQDTSQPSAKRFVSPPVRQLVHNAQQQFDGDAASRRYWGPSTPWASDVSGAFTYRGLQFQQPVYWREGMCDLARVHGRCPVAKDEALMQATTAKVLKLEPGDTFGVTYQDDYLVRSRTAIGGNLREVQRPRTVSFTLTGTYTVPDPGTPAWFDLSRFTGLDNLVPPPGGPSSVPRAPALLVSPGSIDSAATIAGVDRPVRTSAVDLADLDDAQRAADGFKAKAIDLTSGVDVQVLPDLDTRTVFSQVRSERGLLVRVMVAALAPLIALALLLLFALVSSAAQVRRPYVALAKLRGQTGAQVFWFAVAEPFLVIAVAVPIGVALAYAAARVIATGWLHPGIPVGADTFTVVCLAAVVGASLLAATVAALGVIREPLSVALAASVRPRPSSRVGLVLKSAVVAVALAAVGNIVTSKDQSSQLLALLTPTFVALAVAVGGAVLLRTLSRAWVRRTADAGGAPSYLASRRLARRQDLANLMVPLLLAVAVLTFASSATATSDDWRVSRADAEVGAARTFDTTASPGRLLHVTRDVDPDGRYLMATVVNDEGDDMHRGVFVDSSRLATVASWDPAWSGSSLSSLQRKLVLDEKKRIAFTGRELAVTLDKVRLTSKTHARNALQVQYVDDTGEQRDQLVGMFRNGGRQVLRTPIEDCTRTCYLEQLYVTGDSVSVTDAQGRLTLVSASLDGRPVDWGFTRTGAWRAARPFPVSLVDPPVLVDSGPGGLRMRLFLGELPPGQGPQRGAVAGFARITPSSTPDVEPVVVASGTSTQTAQDSGSGLAIDYPESDVVGTGVGGQDVPMHVVARVEALPVIGDVGEMADLETSLVEFEPPVGALVTTQLWAAPGTPESVLAQVRDQGITLSHGVDRAERLHELRNDAFSLGLRLFLVVGAFTLLLAIFGVLASAVLQSRWRSYEVASLRVVGVRQRALVRGSVLEYAVLLGLAVVLGVLSAYLSLELVLPSMSLGTAAPFDPEPTYSVHWPIVLGVGVGLFLVATLIAVLVSRRITRLGKPSTLRWAEQG